MIENSKFLNLRNLNSFWAQKPESFLGFQNRRGFLKWKEAAEGGKNLGKCVGNGNGKEWSEKKEKDDKKEKLLNNSEALIS